jgi:hypothetical protein
MHAAVRVLSHACGRGSELAIPCMRPCADLRKRQYAGVRGGGRGAGGSGGGGGSQPGREALPTWVASLSGTSVGDVLQQMHERYLQNLPPGEGAVPFYPAPTLSRRLPQQPPQQPQQPPQRAPRTGQPGMGLQVTKKGKKGKGIHGQRKGGGNVRCSVSVRGTKLYLGCYPPLQERLLMEA